jgi:pyruvate dehydrogenase E1 component alpha subunit
MMYDGEDMVNDRLVESLKAFEQDIAEQFNAGRIRAPVHLSGGNEQQLIDIFKEIKPSHWVCGSWRLHYHCLLKGVPPEELRAAIMSGKSISLCFPRQRVISSAIVGGILPIAVGIAMGIKRSGEESRVWAFMGDMTSMTGIAHECMTYSFTHNLPIVFVTEDNGLSVCTDTYSAWRTSSPGLKYFNRYYAYKLPWPHAGAGKRVQF